MKTVHLFEDGYYFISNKAVAKCFMFRDKFDCIKFQEKLDRHLSPLCDILAYGFGHDSFKIALRLKSRDDFERYFLSKFDKGQEVGFIPESTYIFAQAMANLQSGYAKYFNFKYDRDGGLMKGRYMRKLVESEEELDQIIECIHNLQEVGNRSRIWTFRRKEDGFLFNLSMDSPDRSSRIYYRKVSDGGALNCFKRKSDIDMRGHFVNLPPKRIVFKNSYEKFRNVVSFIFMMQV